MDKKLSFEQKIRLAEYELDKAIVETRNEFYASSRDLHNKITDKQFNLWIAIHKAIRS